jgi:RND family efflux transporter MFP subunit
MKRSHKIIIIAFLLLGYGCNKQPKNIPLPKSVEDIPVKTISLHKSVVTEIIHSSGQFTTDDETTLAFKTGGIIERIYVKKGDLMRKGQLLASLDLTEVSAQVNQAQLALDKASRDYIRNSNLSSDSVVTLEQLQNSKTGLEIARQQLVAAKFNLRYSEIRATHDGVVLNKMANEGQIVGPGAPIFQISSKGQTDWILQVAVSDKEWAQIMINDKAEVQIEALNLSDMDAFVFSKTEDADKMTGSFSIDIKLHNARKLKLASGMFGKAEIRLSQNNQVWQIPYDSLLDGNANEGFVFVTNNNKNVLKVPVRIYGIEKNNVLISEGLSNYKSIIVSGSAYLTDKSHIKVVNN